MEIAITIGIALISALILFLCNTFVYKPIKRWKKNFRIIWKSVGSLTHTDIMDLRGLKKYGFNKFYEDRNHDVEILNRIINDENVLLVGNPLAGKTRSIYEALKKLDKSYHVLVPRHIDIESGDYKIPFFFRFWKIRKVKKILFIDDLNKFVLKQQNYLTQLYENIDENIIVISTCRTGPELDKFLKSGHSQVFEHTIEAPKMSKQNAKTIAEKAGVKFPDRFDGNVGSIFLRLDDMRSRYQGLNSDEKKILLSIKRLHLMGVFLDREIFPLKWLYLVCSNKYDMTTGTYEWDEKLKRLKEYGFIEEDSENVRVEEAYLDKVIEGFNVSPKDFHEMLNIFKGDPEALYNLGSRAYEIGVVVLDKAELMKVAIDAHKGALVVWTRKSNPEKYARAKNGLGAAYWSLSEVEVKKENVKRAIDAYDKALKVRTLKKYPPYYAMTKMNMGVAYLVLSGAEDKEGNSKRAIEDLKEALKIFTFDHFSLEYATTLMNMGVAYWKLSEFEDKIENSKKSIETSKKALKIFSFDNFPMDYAMIKMNLGLAYSRLSEADYKRKNIKRSIKFYEEALSVFTPDKFTVQYAKTQVNLGTAYGKIAEVEEPYKNTIKELQAYKEAIKIFREDKFPDHFQYIIRNSVIAVARLEELGVEIKEK